MKINTVKFIFAIALALILGFVCETIATDAGGRNWITLAVASITMCSGLIPAFGLNYDNAKRGLSIRVLAWMTSGVLLTSNVIFSLFEYKIDLYIAINLLICVIGWIAVYGLFSSKSAD